MIQRQDRLPKGRRIALDWVPPPGHPVECLWSPDQVAARLIESVRVMQRHAGRVGPRGYTPAWGIEVAAEELSTGEKAKMIPEGELDAYEQRLAAERNRYLMGASQQEMSRAEEAMFWPQRYLAQHEGALRVLRAYIVCRALRKRFGATCKRRGWSRATAYRMRDRGLAVIALGLARDMIRINLAEIDDGDADELE